jgi:hypothetical protein
MRGVVNLLIMLLLITNIKNVLTSLQQNGFTLSQVVFGFAEKKLYAIPENYLTLGGWMVLPLFAVVSYFVEYLATKGVPRLIVFLLILANQLALLAFPIYFSY